VFWFVVYCFLQCGELCVEEELVRLMTPVIEKTAFKGDIIEVHFLSCVRLI